MTDDLDFSETYARLRAERRIEERRRVLRGATLGFNKGYGALEGLVKNQSEHGARISFGDTAAVPNAFDLSISGDDRRRPAKVVWRTMREVGVEIV